MSASTSQTSESIHFGAPVISSWAALTERLSIRAPAGFCAYPVRSNVRRVVRVKYLLPPRPGSARAAHGGRRVLPKPPRTRAWVTASVKSQEPLPSSLPWRSTPRASDLVHGMSSFYETPRFDKSSRNLTYVALFADMRMFLRAPKGQTDVLFDRPACVCHVHGATNHRDRDADLPRLEHSELHQIPGLIGKC